MFPIIRRQLLSIVIQRSKMLYNPAQQTYNVNWQLVESARSKDSFSLKTGFDLRHKVSLITLLRSSCMYRHSRDGSLIMSVKLLR